MKTADIVSGFFIAIFLYLILQKPDTTAEIIKALAGGLGNITANLQGRDTGN